MPLPVRVIPNRMFPVGFRSDGVSGPTFRDWIWSWRRFCWVSCYEAALEHDLSYYLGMPVDITDESMWPVYRDSVPRENDLRTEIARKHCDQQFKLRLREWYGFGRRDAAIKKKALRWFGKGSYYWATPRELARRATRERRFA